MNMLPAVYCSKCKTVTPQTHIGKGVYQCSICETENRPFLA